jgi:hypothetical protein
MLRMLLVGIGSYLKLVLRYEYLVLDIPHQDTVYFGYPSSGHYIFVTMRGYLSRPKCVREEKNLENSGLKCKKPKNLIYKVPKCVVLNTDRIIYCACHEGAVMQFDTEYSVYMCVELGHTTLGSSVFRSV